MPDTPTKVLIRKPAIADLKSHEKHEVTTVSKQILRPKASSPDWAFFDEFPLVAILRQITPDQIVAVVDILIDAGFRTIEVPLTSPDALKSIELIATKFGDFALIGGGTVLSPDDVQNVYNAGGRMIVSPNVSKKVIRTATHRQAQRFLTAHDPINLIFRPRRHSLTATSYRHARGDVFSLWADYTAEMAA